MIEFFIANIGTILVGLVVLGIVGAVVRSLIRDNRSGKCASCANCSINCAKNRVSKDLKVVPSKITQVQEFK